MLRPSGYPNGLFRFFSRNGDRYGFAYQDPKLSSIRSVELCDREIVARSPEFSCFRNDVLDVVGGKVVGQPIGRAAVHDLIDGHAHTLGLSDSRLNPPTEVAHV
jgi:hypothetical protein